jgi:dephospho-CoA kinase
VLRVGLTGGIGSGKSTVARRLVDRGAVLVDSDVLAREVVAPGTAGLEEIVAAFGTGVLGPDGGLDRPALAAVVFGDPDARERLNAIVHPRVRDRTEELVAEAAPDAIVVQDVPLLVETRSPAAFDLVVVVDADVEVRVRRLVDRGLTAADARSRIAAQADDAARRAAADVWLENDGARETLDAAVDALWHRRLVPFEANLRTRRPVSPPAGGPVDPDRVWALDGARLAARVARAAGDAGRGAAHVGPTAVPGVPAEDVLDVQVAVDPADVDDARANLDRAGFPRVSPKESDTEESDTEESDTEESDTEESDTEESDTEESDTDESVDGEEWRHAGADPGRPLRVHLVAAGSPAWRAALLRRDWLRSDAVARTEYAHLVRSVPEKRRWERTASTRAEDWAAASGWAPEDPAAVT